MEYRSKIIKNTALMFMFSLSKTIDLLSMASSVWSFVEERGLSCFGGIRF